MAVGYSPKLPLLIDSVDGFYKLNKTLGEVVKQNLKMIILTSPGERIMEPDFGVGARNYLFDSKRASFQNLKSKIIQQVEKYLPYIRIVKISTADSSQENSSSDAQTLGISIAYNIPNMNLSESMTITISA